MGQELTQITNVPSTTPMLLATSLTWRDVLAGEKEKPYFRALMERIDRDRQSGKIIYPARQDVFNALTLTPFDSVRVVIIGQDPYPGPNQAHGLCFSVRHGVALPGSLQ